MEAVLEVKETRIAEYQAFLVALFSGGWGRQWETVKPGIDESLLISRCDEALESLPYKMRTVLRLRFGLDDGRRRTLSEVGQELYPKVVRQRIFQIQEKAISKLRHPSRSRKLYEFIDYVRRD